MKPMYGIPAIMIAALLTLVGCSGGSKVDTSAVEKSFAPAEANLKTTADKAMTALKNSDYKGALVELQGLVKDAKINDEQKKAVNDVMAQVQKTIAETVNKAAGEASKALEGAQKTFGK